MTEKLIYCKRGYVDYKLALGNTTVHHPHGSIPTKCPISGKPIDPQNYVESAINGRYLSFCGTGCIEKAKDVISKLP